MEVSILSDTKVEEITGGVIVDDDDGQKFWFIRKNGTVIAPVQSKKAIEFAQAYHIST